MVPKPIWTEETIVRISETDFRKRWKPAGFFQAMQEAAAHHADHLGFGYEKMMADEKIWILSRVKLVFHRFPTLQERVILQTWPKGIQQKLFFMRDFHLVDTEGLRYASASTAWLLVNPTARRLLMPAALEGALPDNHGLAAVEEPLEKITVPDGLPEAFTADTRFSAVDLMGHVNNARYAEWICDCFSFDEWSAREIESLQVNYVNEVRPGERVSICAGPQPGNSSISFVTGINHSTGSRAFEAQLNWR